MKYMIAFFVFLIFISSASAFSFTLYNVNSTSTQVNIGSIESIYAYEINLDYTGTISEIAQANFLSINSSASYGYNERNGVLSVYGSQLNNSKPGVSGSGELFNVSYSGTLSRRYGLVVYTNGTEEYVYYNNTETGSGSSSSNSGGGGGGGIGFSPTGDFIVEPELLSVELKQGETKRVIITVTNTGGETITINSHASSISKLLKISEETFSILSGQAKKIIVDIIASENETPDSYLGKIIFKSGNTEKIVNVAIDIKAAKPLFDVLVDVQNKTVSPGEDVTALIEIFNLGELSNIDALLYYSVRDFEGNIITESSESLAIERRIAVIRQMNIPENISPGKYIVYARVSYGEIQAAGTQAFDITGFQLAPLFDNKTVSYFLWGLVTAGIVVVIILGVSILRNIRKRQVISKIMKTEEERIKKEVYVRG